jgi:uncharacterized membrane protein
MQNEPQIKRKRRIRKRWWQKLEHWLYTPGDSYFFFTLAFVMVYWWRGLPIWILFFPSMYLIYGNIVHYKRSAPLWIGRKKIEKVTNPILYRMYSVFWMLVILLFIFFDVGNFISSLFRSDVTHGVCC